MATPFVAGTAALILSALAAKDGVFFGRGQEVKDLLMASQQRSEALDFSQKTFWGSGNLTNGVISMQRAATLASAGTFEVVAFPPPPPDGYGSGGGTGSGQTPGGDSGSNGGTGVCTSVGVLADELVPPLVLVYSK